MTSRTSPVRHTGLALLLSLAAASAALAQGPSPDDLLAANRDATLTPAAPGRGAVTLAYGLTGQSMAGRGESVFDLATGAFVDTYQLGPQDGAEGFDGQRAWMRDPSGAVTPQDGGDKRQLAVNEAYRYANLWWRPDHAGAAIRGLGTRADGAAAYDVLEVTPRGGKAFEAWFDRRSHLLAAVVEQQGPRTLTARYTDYRLIYGMRLAARVVDNSGLGPGAALVRTLREVRMAPARPSAAYGAPEVTLADAAIQNARGRITIPFQLVNNHVYAQVSVNGQGPYPFIFDTGGHNLLTPAAASDLALRPVGQGAGAGAGEGVVEVGFLRGVTFRIGDLVLRDQAAAVAPFTTPETEGIPAQGMMGFELFRRFVTVIDYGAQTLTFIDPSRFDPTGAGVAVPFVFYGHLPQVAGTFEGRAGVFDVDTGSRVDVTLTKPFVDHNGLKAGHPRGVVAVDGWGLGGRSISYVTRARELTMGPVEVKDLVAGMATQSRGAFADASYQGNIGSGILKRFVVTFDYDHQIMYLKRLPGPVADVATFDRAGMWINGSPAGFRIVDLTPGGAAQAADLAEGDQITAVDGRPASAWGLSDLRRRLRDPGVRSVSLTVLRAGESRHVTLRLRDQI